MTFLDPSPAAESYCDNDGQAEAESSAAGAVQHCRSLPAASRPNTKNDADSGLLDEFWPHVPALRGYLRKRVPPADVDDVLQDIFLNIVRRELTGTITHPKCYLFQAAQTALVDRHRRQTARRSSFHCELGEAEDPVDERSPLRILLAKDDIRAAEDVLRELPERTKEIIVAVRLEGMSLKSLANRYNISTSAIEKHVTKASKALSRVHCGDPLAAPCGHPTPLRERYLAGSI